MKRVMIMTARATSIDTKKYESNNSKRLTSVICCVTISCLVHMLLKIRNFMSRGKMLLKIRNFKCHKILDININNAETTLISGPSGRGKTTVIDALMWCLYGSQSLIRGCADDCDVTIENTDLLIRRQRRPKRLQVMYMNHVYDDAQAQYVIDRLYGPEDLFMCTSVIEQGSLNRFFDLKAADKFKLITDMIFDSTDDSLEQKVQTRLQNVKSTYTNLLSQYEALNASYQRFISGINFRQLDVSNVDDLRSYSKNVQAVPQLKHDIQRLTRQLEDAVREESRYTEMMKQVESLTQQLQEHQSTQLPQEPSVAPLDLTALMYRRAELDRELKNCEEYHRLMSVPGVQELCGYEPDDLFRVPPSIASEEQLRRYEEVTQLIKDHRGHGLPQSMSVIKISVQRLHEVHEESSVKIKELTASIDALQSELRSISGAVRCPHCSNHVIIQGMKLHPLSSVPDGRENEIRAEIKRLTEELTKNERIHDTTTRAIPHTQTLHDTDVPHTLITELAALKDELNNFKIRDIEVQKSCELPVHVMELVVKYGGRSVVDSVRKFKSLKCRPKSEVLRDMTKIDDELTRGGEVNALWRKYDSELESHRQKTSMLKRQMMNLNPVKPDTSVIDQLRAHIEEHRLQSVEISKIKDMNNIIERTCTVKNRMCEEESRLLQMHETGTQLYNELALLERLKDKIKNIIAAAIDKKLNEISSLVNYYASSMFSACIQVDIRSQKDVKSTGLKKNEINFTIKIDGRDTDIKSMSGGEKSRLSMAFTLALNTLAATSHKLLIMDESLSGLDDVNRETCIDIIEERCKSTGITSISVLHGCDEGAFDNIVKLQ